MKGFGRTLASLLLTVLLFAGFAHAQYVRLTIQVEVPFEFRVGNKTFPAGGYRIVRNNPSTLVLQDSKGRVLTVMMTIPVWSATAPAAPKLLFYQYGKQHVLARIWQQGSSVGQELPLPKQPAAESSLQATGAQP
jgi:hypothetical protein